MTTLLVNAIITPDGTRLESTHRHDFKTHIDANGEEYMVDGGLDYMRGSVNKIPATNACVTSDDDHSIIREAFTWGTYGKDGSKQLVRLPIASLEDDHIAAILRTQLHLSAPIAKLFSDELLFRAALSTETNSV
jgi:hypothetical protein